MPSRSSSGHRSRSKNHALRSAHSNTTRYRVVSTRTTSPPMASLSSYSAYIPYFSRTLPFYSPGTLAYPFISIPPSIARSRTNTYYLSRPMPRRPTSWQTCSCNMPYPSSPASYKAYIRPSYGIVSTWQTG